MRSVAVDLLTGPALLRTAAWLATMWAIGPIIGPVIGSYLQVYIGWQANFLFFAIYGFISLIACLLWLPETHHKRTALSFKRVKNNFSLLLRHKVFMSISVLMGCLFSFLVVFNSLGPFFIEKKLGYTPIFFGHAAFCLGIIALCGTFFCRALIKRFTSQKILSIALPMVLICALLGVLITHYYSNNVWAILIPTAVLYFSNGILYPTCMGATMSLFREIAGSAAAIASLINLCIATLSGFLMSLINVQSATSIATACAAFIFIGFSFYTWAIRAEEPVQAITE
jgi:predicted MFS family arabinose efflux permease